MAKSPNISRREFVALTLGALGGIIGAVVGVPAIGYLLSPALSSQKQDAWIALGALENYPVDVPTLFTFTRTKINGWEKTVNSYGVLVIRKANGSISAFSNICTHLGCRVNWKSDAKQFVCPCHDGRFDIAGKVLSGPPPRPMDSYETKVENGNLSIHFVKG